MAVDEGCATQRYVPDVGTYYVRVLGMRLDRFVEFEFAIGDPEQLMVELIMPVQAFGEFCAKYNTLWLPPRDADAENAIRRALGQSGDAPQNNELPHGESQ